jgi:hypothetical protein
MPFSFDAMRRNNNPADADRIRSLIGSEQA